MEIMNQFEKQLWFHNRKEGKYNSYGDKTGGGLVPGCRYLDTHSIWYQIHKIFNGINASILITPFYVEIHLAPYDIF